MRQGLETPGSDAPSETAEPQSADQPDAADRETGPIETTGGEAARAAPLATEAVSAEPVEAAIVSAEAATSSAPQRRAVEPMMPDDPRNAPDARSHLVMSQIAAKVRLIAKKNREQGVSTYEGRDPHPRIVEKTGWRRGPAMESPEKPPLSAKELALRALEAGEPMDAVEPPPPPPPPAPAQTQSPSSSRVAPSKPSPTPSREPAAAEAVGKLQPLLAEWLGQNLQQLIQELVREEMDRSFRSARSRSAGRRGATRRLTVATPGFARRRLNGARAIRFRSRTPRRRRLC